jgi:hypothetical protein
MLKPSLLLILLASSTSAFISSSSRAGSHSNSNVAFTRTGEKTLSSSSSRLQATAVDAIAAFESSQLSTVNKIAAAIPDLEVKPSLSWASEPVAGQSTKLDARDAPGPANIAWLAAVCVPNVMSSLTIFNGPLTDVPHLLSRCIIAQSTNTMTLALDFRPRAYGAYELPESERSPDKLGRDSFTYSGNRKEYESKFVNEEVLAFLQSTATSLEGATALPTGTNEYETLTKGPHLLNVQMPLTDANVAAVIAAREKAADYWLSWQLEDTHAHRPGAPINAQYLYDSKYRQNAYMALLPVHNEVFGADGNKIAAAESGPLDEGYVGGGS